MVWPWNDHSGRLSPIKLAGFAALFVPAARVMLAYAAGVIGTGLGEALYFRLAFHAGLMRVLDANFSAQTGIRPAAVVFVIGLAVTAGGGVRAAGARPAPRRLRPAELG